MNVKKDLEAGQLDEDEDDEDDDNDDEDDSEEDEKPKKSKGIFNYYSIENNLNN